MSKMFMLLATIFIVVMLSMIAVVSNEQKFILIIISAITLGGMYKFASHI